MKESIRNKMHEILEIPRMNRLYERVRKTYEDSSLFAHGWDHIHRTLVNAFMIAEEMDNADYDIFVPAMLLHDIGFIYDHNPTVHHLTGADNCRAWLDEWNDEERAKIESCIRKHKGMMEGFNTRPGTIEECIVCDSDLLEKTGHIGILQGVRTFIEFGEGYYPKYRTLNEIAKHLQGVKDLEFFTEPGRAIADNRGGMQVRLNVFTKAMEEMKNYH